MAERLQDLGSIIKEPPVWLKNLPSQHTEDLEVDPIELNKIALEQGISVDKLIIARGGA